MDKKKTKVKQKPTIVFLCIAHINAIQKVSNDYVVIVFFK